MTDYDPGVNPYGSFMMGPAVPEGTKARAGAKLEGGVAVASDEAIIEALRTVHDPEIPVNIYDLGLIYDVQVDDKKAKIKMTLTSPNCPVAETLPKDVKDVAMQVEEIDDVDLELVWDPPWNKDMMSEAAKLELNL
mgnify:CR=1 FL=1